jgi:ABC-type glutathione transport system ATPase component
MTATVLEVDNLKKHFPIRRGLLRGVVGQVKAVDGVSLSIRKGETLSLVGESGCGKTTVSRCIVRALRPTSGAVRFRIGEGPMVDVAQLARRALASFRPHMQMIFQDPFSSLNPRMMIGDIIAEPMLVNGIGDKQSRRAGVEELLDLVKLPAAYRNRFPHASRAASAAHRHRACAGLEPEPRGRRQAGLRARCVGAGARRQSDARAAAGLACPTCSWRTTCPSSST